MLEYLEKIPPFVINPGLTGNKILDTVEFLLPMECQKELIIQGFDSATQGLTELVKFCERLETVKELFQMYSYEQNQNKKPISPVSATNMPSKYRSKGQTRPQNHRKMMRSLKKNTCGTSAWTWT